MARTRPSAVTSLCFLGFLSLAADEHRWHVGADVFRTKWAVNICRDLLEKVLLKGKNCSSLTVELLSSFCLFVCRFLWKFSSVKLSLPPSEPSAGATSSCSSQTRLLLLVETQQGDLEMDIWTEAVKIVAIRLISWLRPSEARQRGASLSRPQQDQTNSTDTAA